MNFFLIGFNDEKEHLLFVCFSVGDPKWYEGGDSNRTIQPTACCLYTWLPGIVSTYFTRVLVYCSLMK